MATYNKTSFLNDEILMEKELIKKTIEGYFDARYTVHKTLHDIDLEQYVSKSERGMSFLNAEKEKLEVELFNTKKNKLRYADYKVFLDFNEINIDAANQSATVLLQEGHDVVAKNGGSRTGKRSKAHSKTEHAAHRFGLKPHTT